MPGCALCGSVQPAPIAKRVGRLALRQAPGLLALQPMNSATATHRLVGDVPACVAGSGERQLRLHVVGDGGVDDLAVDPAVGPEVDAHPIGRRGSNRHSLFDTAADEPGMVIEATLPAAERQQVGILDKRLLQPVAEAVGIKAGPSRLDNDIKVNRPQPGWSNRALVLGQMVDSVQDESPCPFQKEYNLGYPASG